MRSRWLLGLVAVICAIAATLAFSGCTTILGSFDIAPAGTGVAAGIACSTGSQCASGFCSDGVCCESACRGTCEACNLVGTAGKCTPVPDGQDPALECPTDPLTVVDAGVDIVDLVDAAIGDASTDASDDGGVTDGGGASDAGVTFALPETGVSTSDSPCAGSCNGQRACKYPGTERTCGTTFCATPTTQGRAACDTKGHCLVGTETCETYSCADGSAGCKASCTSESDCQPSFFCDALSSTCKPKLGDGSACTSLAQCQKGHCVEGVCCNDGCTGFPGATCTKPGKVGKCSCTACADGTCQLYYKDEDGDGYGDKGGTVVNGRAAPGCVGVPPVGFVADNTDCLDGPKQVPYTEVHPGQTDYFPTPYTGPSGNSYDYDCSATLEKYTPEYPGSYCGYCRSTGFLMCAQASACSTAGQQSGLGCGLGFGSCGGRPCSFSCQTSATIGFANTIECGATGTVYNCGGCSVANGGTSQTFTYGVIQRCH